MVPFFYIKYMFIVDKIPRLNVKYPTKLSYSIKKDYTAIISIALEDVTWIYY